MASKGDIHLEEASGQEARPQPGQGVAATLDTSGHFHVMPGHPLHRFMGVNRLEWSDISPFTQGYVEALFASAAVGSGLLDRHGQLGLGFSDLAPETLARIMEDCAAWQKQYRAVGNFKQSGRQFWELRTAQHVERNTFPPLTPYLGDDGKVCLRDAAQ